MEVLAPFEAYISQELTLLLEAYVKLFADNMVFLIQLGAPILILYYGYSIMSGRGSNATVSEMMWNMARIGMIFAFMQNTGNLLDLSIDFIQEIKSGFVGKASVFALLDQQLTATKNLTVTIMKIDDSFGGINGRIASLMVWGGAITVLAIATIVFIANEVGLTLLLATAPIFIGCLSYGFLKEMFNGWLRGIFSCITTLIFAGLVVRIGLDANSKLIAQLVNAPAQNGIISTGSVILLISLIVGALILVSKNMAGSIAGVAASSAIQGGMTAVAAATTTRGVSSTIQGGRNLKSNISASVANRTRLAESVQKAAAERVKQNNLK